MQPAPASTLQLRTAFVAGAWALAACTQDYGLFASGAGATAATGGAATTSSSDGGAGLGAGGGGAGTSTGSTTSTASTTTGNGGGGGTAAGGGSGGTPVVCGNAVVEPGEECDDASPFCAGCQFTCPAGWAPSATSGCFKVMPVVAQMPDWPAAKSWADASVLCPAQAPAGPYVGRLAGPGVLDVLGQLGDCPQIHSGGTGGCWIGAQCPNAANCASGQKSVALEWVDGPVQSIPNLAWSTGNPSGDGACVEYIPNEGINDDNCSKLELYVCEVALAP